MTNDVATVITKRKAMGMVPRRALTYTVVEGGTFGIKEEWSRYAVLKEILYEGNRCELSGPHATRDGFGLVIIRTGGRSPLFVKTKGVTECEKP